MILKGTQFTLNHAVKILKPTQLKATVPISHIASIQIDQSISAESISQNMIRLSTIARTSISPKSNLVTSTGIFKFQNSFRFTSSKERQGALDDLCFSIGNSIQSSSSSLDWIIKQHQQALVESSNLRQSHKDDNSGINTRSDNPNNYQQKNVFILRTEATLKNIKSGIGSSLIQNLSDLLMIEKLYSYSDRNEEFKVQLFKLQRNYLQKVIQKLTYRLGNSENTQNPRQLIETQILRDIAYVLSNRGTNDMIEKKCQLTALMAELVTSDIKLQFKVLQQKCSKQSDFDSMFQVAHVLLQAVLLFPKLDTTFIEAFSQLQQQRILEFNRQVIRSLNAVHRKFNVKLIEQLKAAINPQIDGQNKQQTIVSALKQFQKTFSASSTNNQSRQSGRDVHNILCSIVKQLISKNLHTLAKEPQKTPHDLLFVKKLPLIQLDSVESFLLYLEAIRTVHFNRFTIAITPDSQISDYVDQLLALNKNHVENVSAKPIFCKIYGSLLAQMISYGWYDKDDRLQEYLKVK